MSMEITEVLTRYGTQEKCIEYLEGQKWGGVPKCPYCESERSTRRKDGLRIKCHGCNKSYTVLVGSIMESTKLPLVKWFAAMCLMLHAKKGISSLQLSRDIHPIVPFGHLLEFAGLLSLFRFAVDLVDPFEPQAIELGE